ncbi:MAG: M20/M25/M40 family metallo-hydrolase [Clostridia bacterium]|nr:M20/M25/M40 family metallo-hydrolase [Clostridia bacterium]
MWLPILIVLLVVYFAVIFIRALLFVPKKNEIGTVSEVKVDAEKATNDLAEMIRCKTISHRDESLDDVAEFEKFEQVLPGLFPNIHATCEFEKPGDRSLLFRWKGKSPDSPSVFMAHYDVVSVEEADWTRPAFDGILEDGFLWGRGTLDTKGTVNGVLQAAEALIASGFVPKNDIYFAFGGNEEVNGDGAKTIVDLFRHRGITPGLVLDEGGAVCTKVFPGVKAPIALIGTGEKGQLNIKYTVKGGGGHSSSPKANGPVIRLSKAALKVEKASFKYTLSQPAAELFDTAGRHSTFLYRILFANLWCFAPVLALYAKLSGGEFNAIVRTTTAFTQMSGSKGANVIPAVATMVSNHRIIPGENVESVVAHVKKAVNDDKVDVSVINGINPSVISKTDCEAYERVRSTVAETWQEAIVSPYLMVAGSDSRHWGAISDKVYRFSAMALSKEERGMIHGNDERIPVETICRTVEFYIRMMKKC